MIVVPHGWEQMDFIRLKFKFIEPTCKQLQKWNSEGNNVKILSKNNAGKKLFEEHATSSDWKLGTKFEYTARPTPQYNSTVEVYFATWAHLACAMLSDDNFDMLMWWKPAKKCQSLVNKNCNLVVMQFNNQTVTRYEGAGQELLVWTKNLRLFGKARWKGRRPWSYLYLCQFFQPTQRGLLPNVQS